MIRRSSIVTCALALVAAGALAVQDAVKIAWAPKAGKTSKYSVHAKFRVDIGSGEQDVNYKMTVTQKVLEVMEDGKVKIEEKVGNQSLVIGDQDMSEMVQGMDYGTTYVFLPNGEVHERKMDGPQEMDNPRMEDAMAFIYPGKELKPGETWTRSTKADSSKGRVATETVYTFRGVETIDGKKVSKIDVKFKELEGDLPTTGEGTVWLGDEGDVVKGEYKLNNIIFAEGVPPVNATMTMQRVE
ncbi:MAG TPA: hypothetical protein VM328_05505 [Fimbriimonadaceae bacterium]|nr:hypothetical protein [Fimbriimonadaceae bacterium]